jgi:hypothetical protein
VAGSSNVVDTSSGNAVSGDILAGRRAWVDGTEVTGSMPVRTVPSNSVLLAAGYYAGTNLTAVERDLVPGNIRSGAILFGINGSPSVVDTSSGDADASSILEGVSAWVNGTEVFGAIPYRTLDSQTNLVPAGYYYEGRALDEVDAQLAATNIRGGVVIFGFEGTRYAPVAKTGQRASFNLPAGGDDGDLEPGVAWPSNRFELTGTSSNLVLDRLTGLVWVRNGGLRGAALTWTGAVSYCQSLVYEGRDDWRLPSRFEMESLTDLGQSASPVLPTGHPFTNVFTEAYWTGTTDAQSTGNVWTVSMDNSRVERSTRTASRQVWPVAGGE